MKFTQRAIEALRPADSDVVLWDDELPGFGVRVKPTGAKAYIVQYRIGRRSRRMTVGNCAVFKLEQARKRARKHLVSAKDGFDPLADREAARYAPTVQGLAERYLAEHAEPHKKRSSIAADRRNLDNHILPVLGRLTVKDVTRADIDRLKMKVAGGSTARDEKVGPRARRIVRGGPGAANRCLALLSKMFHLAERWGVRLHDLRHSYASAGAAGGYSLHIIGALLGHTSAATTARYAHLANDPVRQASDAIGAQLAAAMAGSGGEVVALRRNTK